MAFPCTVSRTGLQTQLYGSLSHVSDPEARVSVHATSSGTAVQLDQDSWTHAHFRDVALQADHRYDQ